MKFIPSDDLEDSAVGGRFTRSAKDQARLRQPAKAYKKSKPRPPVAERGRDDFTESDDDHYLPNHEA